MSDVDKYLVLKMDERSEEADDGPTVWVQVAAIDADGAAFTCAASSGATRAVERVLTEWLAEPDHKATAAGTYLVAHIEVDAYRAGVFTVTPRVEFDVAANVLVGS